MVTRTLTELIREVDPDFDSDPPPAEYRFRGGRIFRALPRRGPYDGTIYATDLVAEQGYFSFQGKDAGLFPSSYILPVAKGAFALTGNSVSKFVPSMAATGGSFTLTGRPANLVPSAAFLTMGAGSFTLSGIASSFASQMPAEGGTYALTGNDAALSTRAANSLAAAPGSFTLLGVDALFSEKAASAAGSFFSTGRAASLDRLLSQTFATMEASYLPTNGADLVTQDHLVALVNAARREGLIGTLTAAAGSYDYDAPVQELFWDDISGEDGYRVKWGTSASVYTQSQDVGANVLSCTLTGLLPLTQYYWVVVGLLAGVEQTLSAEATFTTLAGRSNATFKTTQASARGTFTLTGIAALLG
jgi:hypothetical protein